MARRAMAALACVAAIAATAPALAQLDYVLPRRPTPSNVRHADMTWLWVDLAIDLDGASSPDESALTWTHGPRMHVAAFPGADSGTPWDQRQPVPSTPTPPPAAPTSPGAKRGGVRLFFYERERALAERAAASIEATTRRLAAWFRYAPERPFPYFLYGSYIEFLETQLFPIVEGVLGVTGLETLDVALPYFGDHRRFEQVSTHELVHQFTIQLAASRARAAGFDDDPVLALPLWFIEGLAEYLTHGGIDPETEMLVRDLVVNPRQGRVLGGFFDDRPQSGIWSYKVGQARCAFLAEAYGEEILRRIIETAPRLLRKIGDEPRLEGLPALLHALTGESPTRISERFDQWVKARAFSAFLRAGGDDALAPLIVGEGLLQALAASPDGAILALRSVEMRTGERRLHLVDALRKRDTLLVAADMRPGVESLHPVADRNFALSRTHIVFIAQSAGSDVLHEVALARDDDGDLELGPRRAFALAKVGITAADSLALSPDGARVAFVGLDREGQRDLFLLTPGPGEAFSVRRLTHDLAAERQVAWGRAGIVFTSDQTDHGRFNVFRLDPDAPPSAPTRLTFDPEDHFDVAVTPGGLTLYTYWHETHAAIVEIGSDGVHRRLSDVATGLFDVAPGPNFDLWALHQHGGRLRPVRLAAASFARIPIARQLEGARAPPMLARLLDDARPYSIWEWQAWRLHNLWLALGASSEGIYGTVLAVMTDRLRDHSAIALATFAGDIADVNALLMIVDHSRRLVWAASLSQVVRFRSELALRDPEGVPYLARERYFSAGLTLRHPFDRFTHLQGRLDLGSARAYLSEPTREALHPDLRARWDRDEGGQRLRTELALALGHTTIQYHRATGPFRGGSILAELSLGVEPWDDASSSGLRLDAELFVPLIGASNLGLRAGLGATWTWGGAPREVMLSSYEILRAVPIGDIDFLVGRHYAFALAELQVPLVTFSTLPLFDIEGLVALDLGAAASRIDRLWDKRVLGVALGLSFGFGPLVLRCSWAVPIDIGAPVPNGGDWTSHVALGWRYQ